MNVHVWVHIPFVKWVSNSVHNSRSVEQSSCDWSRRVKKRHEKTWCTQLACVIWFKKPEITILYKSCKSIVNRSEIGHPPVHVGNLVKWEILRNTLISVFSQWEETLHFTYVMFSLTGYERSHLTDSGGRLNKKDGLTGYGDSHVKDKTS